MKNMEDSDERPHESDTYGISSWVYHERAPLHPQRLLEFLQRPWHNGRLLRCKGYFWVASRYLDIGMLVQSGGQFRWDYVGRWWKFISQSQWPQDDYRRQGIQAKWDDITGDCRQEIVFIGQGLDLDALQRQLDTCLLTPEEIMAGPQAWPTLPGATSFDIQALSP
jgi:G3E family GTPase